jgi:hypothetical protein
MIYKLKIRKGALDSKVMGSRNGIALLGGAEQGVAC